jgi:hypothetical protein
LKRLRSGLSNNRETILDAVSDLPSESTEETSVVRTGLPITSSMKALPTTSRTHQVHTTLTGNTGKMLVTPDSVGALQHHPLLQMQMQQQQQMNIHQIILQYFQSPFLPQQAPLHQAVPSSTGARKHMSRNVHLGMGQPGFSPNTPSSINPFTHILVGKLC